MKTVIHVNQHKIRAGDETPLSVKTYRSNTEASHADIIVNGEAVASVVYSPDRPLSCGAKCWIETEHEVQVIDPQAPIALWPAGGGGEEEEYARAS